MKAKSVKHGGLLCSTCHKVATTLNRQRNHLNRKEKNKLMTKTTNLDVPDGTVDGNLTTNSGDRGSIPGLRRFHLPWSS